MVLAGAGRAAGAAPGDVHLVDRVEAGAPRGGPARRSSPGENAAPTTTATPRAWASASRSRRRADVLDASRWSTRPVGPRRRACAASAACVPHGPARSTTSAVLVARSPLAALRAGALGDGGLADGVGVDDDDLVDLVGSRRAAGRPARHRARPDDERLALRGVTRARQLAPAALLGRRAARAPQPQHGRDDRRPARGRRAHGATGPSGGLQRGGRVSGHRVRDRHPCRDARPPRPENWLARRVVLEELAVVTGANWDAQCSAASPAGMVGLGRIELPTSSLSGMRSNRLSYSPGVQREPRS